MSQIRSVLSMIMMTLVGPIFLMLLGAVGALALFHGEGASRDDRAVLTQAKGATVSDDGETIHVAVEVEEGKASKTMLLHGPGGRDLVRFHVYRDGEFSLEPPSTDPFGLVIHRESSGRVGMGMALGRGRFLVDVRPDGSAEILFKNAGGKIVHDMFVDAEGRILSHASAPIMLIE
jgi:hypothetical protein